MTGAQSIPLRSSTRAKTARSTSASSSVRYWLKSSSTAAMCTGVARSNASAPLSVMRA